MPFKTKPVSIEETRLQQPFAQREFRAAWVASVANINWPSEPGLNVEQQKKEALFLLDLLKDHNYNAVILQVRPQCDAIYPSELEPWSYYLTGNQGQPPEPFYDPLAFWVEEAHKRGLEIHAWLNPYRAHHPSGGEASEHSIVNRKPHLVVQLKNGYWWLDPAKKGTQDHSVAVVMDIVRRYDIDGIHFDDYFYPYASYNDNQDFPDDESWNAYREGGGTLSRGDWRRAAVNTFIERLYNEIKQEKKHVKFGLSPFGIWRPGHPESIRGMDQYEALYADAKLWLNKGWIDYWTPQLYWEVNRIPQSFPVLLGWWKEQNYKQRHIWPGMSLTGKKGEKGIDELLNQIMITRGIIRNNPGQVHWSIAPLIYSPGLVEAVHAGPYREQALIPAMPWLEEESPLPPVVKTDLTESDVVVSWQHDNPSDVFHWVVYRKYGMFWEYEILPAQSRMLDLEPFQPKASFLYRRSDIGWDEQEKALDRLNEVAVSAVDRLGNESVLQRIDLKGVDPADLPEMAELLAAYPSKRTSGRHIEKEPVVKPGIDVLLEDHLDMIANKRVGLITNPSAVTSDLRSTVDALANAPGVNLVALFGAEHGVRGARQGRIYQEGEPDPATGIPVYSLYGDSYAPKQQWLEQLDVLLFDIQGVGSAWYTFKYSMSFAMEACARAGISIIILDRPNPLGGEVVEGPYLDLGNIFRHPLPLRHGMTYGELAQMWNDTEGFGADVTVIRMKGWNRKMTWDNTGLHWVMPSPNMGTFETAVVYPGQCLFERMNMSEARGTTKPFLLSGAPWVDAASAARDLNSRAIPGAVFRPVHFIPKKADAGSNPRGKPWNRLCGGVEIMLTDYKTYRSVEAALHIIDAYRKTNPDSLQWSPPETIKQMDNPGTTVKDVVAACQDEVADFIKRRKDYLLYP